MTDAHASDRTRASARFRVEHWLKLVTMIVAVGSAAYVLLTKIASADFATIAVVKAMDDQTRRDVLVEVNTVRADLEKSQAVTAEREAGIARDVAKQSETIEKIYQLLLQERRGVR